MNLGWGAGAETLANIELLRDADCLAVVSGQQAGLFTGPLYTIYKALSAVKLAGCLRQRNTKAVPVFWIATEDHDFPEVAKAEFIGKDCRLASVDVPLELHREGQPVGHVVLDDSINAVVDRLVELLPVSEFTFRPRSVIARCLEARTRLWRSIRAHDDIAHRSTWSDLPGSHGCQNEATRRSSLRQRGQSGAGDCQRARSAEP